MQEVMYASWVGQKQDPNLITASFGHGSALMVFLKNIIELVTSIGLKVDVFSFLSFCGQHLSKYNVIIVTIFKWQQLVNPDFIKSSGKQYNVFPQIFNAFFKMSDSRKDEGYTGRINFRKGEKVHHVIGIALR